MTILSCPPDQFASADSEVAAGERACADVEDARGLELGADDRRAREPDGEGVALRRPATQVVVTDDDLEATPWCGRGLCGGARCREPCWSRCGRPESTQEDQLVGSGGRVLTDADH